MQWETATLFRFVTNHIYSHVRCGLVDKRISKFSELYGWRGNSFFLLLVFFLVVSCLSY